MVDNDVLTVDTVTDDQGNIRQVRFVTIGVPAGGAWVITDAQPWTQLEASGQIQNEVFRILVANLPVHEETRRAEPKVMSYALRRAPVVVTGGHLIRLEWQAAVGEPAPDVRANFSVAFLTEAQVGL